MERSSIYRAPLTCKHKKQIPICLQTLNTFCLIFKLSPNSTNHLLTACPTFLTKCNQQSITDMASSHISNMLLLHLKILVTEHGKIKGSLTGVTIGTAPGEVTQATKIWRSFQALGAIAFAYSFSLVLIEIQDTIKSPPTEYKTMRKATSLSVAVTTVFYMSCACFGYAAFGDQAPGNLLTGFGYFKPFWLIDIANAAIIIHLVGAFQVFCQPLFAFVERTAAVCFPESKFITKEIRIPIPGYEPYKINLFRLVWRTIFVVVTTVVAMALPFFTDIVGILGALGFWPLTVYFPVEMYMVQKRIPKWSTRWIGFRILSVTCLLVSIAAAAGSIAGVAAHLKVYKPFKS